MNALDANEIKYLLTKIEKRDTELTHTLEKIAQDAETIARLQEALKTILRHSRDHLAMQVARAALTKEDWGNDTLSDLG